MFTTLLAYLLIGVFLFLDRHTRQGYQAKSLERGQYDRGSTTLITVADVRWHVVAYRRSQEKDYASSSCASVMLYPQ